MGLTTWKDAPDGKILKRDVVVAKNYLNEKEFTRLMHVDDKRNDFLSKTKLNEKESETVKSRMIIYDNQNVFSLQ